MALDIYSKAGGIVLAAAGNTYSDLDRNSEPRFCPAQFSPAIGGLISVGSSDKNQKRADFSNYGWEWPDIYAPGVEILSISNTNQVKSFQGTSCSTALASGVVGLIWSHFPEVQNYKLKKILMKSATIINNPNLKSLRLLNVYNTIKELDSYFMENSNSRTYSGLLVVFSTLFS